MTKSSNSLLAAVGLLFTVGAAFDILPLTALASLSSPDGRLSDTLLDGMRHAQGILGATLLACGLAARQLDRALSTLWQRLRASDMSGFDAFLFSISLALALLVQWGLFHNMPHVTDATSNLFQAKIFCLGRLTAPVPTSYEHFMDFKVIMSAKGLWHTKYLPGFPLYLAAFMKLGLVAWAVPLTHAVSSILVCRLTTRFYGMAHGRAAGLLFGLSPLALLLAGSYMSHGPALCFALAGVSLWLRGLHDSTIAWKRTLLLSAAGLFVGLTAITRPQDCVMLGVILAIGLVCARPNVLRTIIRASWPAIPGFLIPVVVLLLWNQAIYDSPFQLGYGATSALSLTPIQNDVFGFSQDYTLRHANSVLGWTMLRFNQALFGWPISLLFAPLPFLRFPWDRRDLFCILASAAIITVYFFYNYYGYEYEARYYYGTIPFFCCLTTRGLERSQELLQTITARSTSNRIVATATVGLLPSLLVAFTLYASAHYWSNYIWPRYQPDYEQGSRVVQYTCQEAGIAQSIVLINCSGTNNFRFTSGMPFNDPLLQADILYARDLPDRNAALLSSFPNRTCYRFIPDTTWRSGQLERLNTP